MEMTSTSAVRTASKDILARLLAAENLTVVHDPKAETASMDTKNRVLTLPVWREMSGATYDMLVGHEVSHALYTPSEEWRAFSERVGGNSHYNIATMYLNIVEDARIERMIKDKFPGLRRDFAAAYRQLHSQDLFGLAEVDDINALGFIDRVNLHFKIGFIEPIAFSAAEQVWVDRIASAKTFDEVMEIAEALYNMAPKEAPETGESEAGQESPETGDDGETGDSGVAAPGEGEPGESEESGAGENGEDGEEGEDQQESGQDGTGGAEGADSSSDDGVETKGDGSMESAADAEDDGSTAESEQKTSEADGDEGAESRTEQGEGPAAPHTYQAEEAGKNGMVDQGAPEYKYAEFPKANLKNIVHYYKSVIADFADIKCETAEKQFAAFERESRPTINAMVQAFNMKKAADEAKRTSEGTTGVLDTVRMVNYKFSDDIFSRYNVVADGKNHGIVALLDWSGSMCDCIQETVQQLQQLILFCKKVNVPFEIYAFTSTHFATADLGYEDEDAEKRQSLRAFPEETADYYGPSDFTLINLASSRMNAREYKRGMVILTQLARNNDYYAEDRQIAPNYGLGGTPLNEAMAAMLDIVPEFKKQTGVQIVNLSILTDGAGGNIHPGGRGWNSVNIFRDPKTNKEYRIDRENDEMNAFLAAIQDRCDARTVGFYFLETLRHVQYSNYFTEAQQREFREIEKEFKKTGVVFAGNSGYDEYFMIKGNAKVDNAGIENIDQDASFTKLKNAFAKSGKNKRVSRTILNRFIDLIAN